MRIPPAKWLVTAVVAIGVGLLLTAQIGLLRMIDWNLQSLRVARAGLRAQGANGAVAYTPEIQALRLELEQRAHSQRSALVHPQLVTLALWASDITAADYWQTRSPNAVGRSLQSSRAWRTVALIRIESPGWNYARETLVNYAWLAGFHLSREGLDGPAMLWFQRGAALAPGRVPLLAKRAYYRSLSRINAKQSGIDAAIVSQKFECLSRNDLDCLIASGQKVLDARLSQWSYETEPDARVIGPNGFELVGLELDEDVLQAGMDVAGWLLWAPYNGRGHEIRRQSFIAPNLVSNPGFEMSSLFRDACVDGYIGSHAFVLPCVSQMQADPLGERDGVVASSHVSDTGYLLVSASAPATTGHRYVYGADLYATRGARAEFGLQFTDEKAAGANPYGQLVWAFVGNGSVSAPSWTRRLGSVVSGGATDIVRVWLGGFSEDTETSESRALFDTLFVFDLSALDF